MSNRQTDHWLARRGTIRGLWWGFAAVLALVVLAEMPFSVKGYFGIDATFGFGAWFGFLSCLALVLIAKLLGAFLKRSETYYQEQGDD